MSSEEAPGTSSSYYSTASSTSSSAENISTPSSTVENGDVSIFTFVTSNRASPDLSHLPEQTDSCVHLPSCKCSCRYRRNGSTGSIGLDRYGLSAVPRVVCRRPHSRQDDNCGFCDPDSSSIVHDDGYNSALTQTGWDGCLVRSLEKGVLYPVIHWAPNRGETLSNYNSLNGNGVLYNQGMYKELKRVIPPDAWMHQSRNTFATEGTTVDCRPTWLIIGYKSLDKTLDSVLESTWKEWTGCRQIYLNLRHDFDIQRISFLTRIHPVENMELFMYLVLMEIGNVSDRNVMWLLDFVQRTRVERMKGFLTVYTEVDNQFSSINEEYIKYLEQISRSKSSDSLPADGVDLGSKKFIDKLLKEIQDTPIVEYL